MSKPIYLQIQFTPAEYAELSEAAKKANRSRRQHVKALVDAGLSAETLKKSSKP